MCFIMLLTLGCFNIFSKPFIEKSLHFVNISVPEIQNRGFGPKLKLQVAQGSKQIQTAEQSKSPHCLDIPGFQ